MTSSEDLLGVLEDTAALLQKAQINLKKCPKARLTKGYIVARLKIIDEYWDTFKNAHQELLRVTPKAEREVLPYLVNEDFYIYEDLYIVMRADLQDMLTLLNSSTTATNTSSSAHNEEQSQRENSLVKLPRIQLPVFSGNYEEWPTFEDLFTSLIHNNKTIEDAQKLHYLKSSVTGEAASLIRHIQVTHKNYAMAWEALKTRYGNKRLIVNSVLKRLFLQKKITSQSANQLKCLLDTTTECLNNLENLDISVNSWDPIIIFLVVQKLDPESHKEWEEYAYRDESEDMPTWSDLTKFIQTRYRTLELISSGSREKTVKERSFHISTGSTNTSTASSSASASPRPTEKKCIMCKNNHTLCHCQEFTKLQPTQRVDYVKTHNLCFNCLVPGHTAYKCRLRMFCRICKRRHHSLLHQADKTGNNTTEGETASHSTAHHNVKEGEDEEMQVNTMTASHHITKQGIALLATAMVTVRSEQNHTMVLRALIDQGSQASFISEKAAQKLRLTKQSVRGTVVGVGSTRTNIKHVVQLQVSSRDANGFNLPVKAYVISKQLTTKIPSKTITANHWSHLEGLNLADPSYQTPGSIDLLLGVKEYAQILQPDIIRGPPGTPSAQKTNLGWILFGEVEDNVQQDTFLVMHHQIDIDEVLKSMWEIDTNTKRKLTREEQLCEEIYEKTHTRNEEGRYVVKLPFNTDSPQSPNGNTKKIAGERFKQLERNLRRLPELKKEYTKVIEDYVEQNHVERVPEKEKDTKKSVYLPHHAVIRNDKETTRTRAVFDASCKGSNNVSLNDELLVGPQLQEDLRNLLIRWRMKRVCFVADIKQMYRQILIYKDDADFQRFLWRADETEDVQEYRLLRVTFGTSPAPYLAVKTLHQVAEDEGNGNTSAIETIQNNFYMDDLLDGADSVDEAVTLANDVTNILQKGGFQLSKWSSNNLEFMKSIDEDKRSAKAHVDLNLEGTIKALGVVWNLNTDTFQYNLTLPPTTKPVTKRGILSDIQKLFDPLGWIAPSTIMAKLLIQKLWLEKVSWDERVSDELEEEWQKIKSDFTNVNQIQVERWLGTTATDKKHLQIHGFCDASMRAYGAAVYIRTETTDNKVETKLVAARTRVAPLKTVSLPRLELCGALLLSKLMKQVSQAMRIPASEMFAWTDSSIVIAWLCGEPHRWKPFVANRVVEILENLNNKHWHHVQSNENPADLASRGILLSELKQCELWWRGPSWLSEKEIKIKEHEKITTDLEAKVIKVNTYLNTDDTKQHEKPITQQFENFHTLTELLKVITYCKRFLNNKKYPNKIENDLTTQELDESLMICIKKVQEEEHKEEIERLMENKQVKKKSLIRSLNPYLDGKQILRVGGRLRHTDLPADKKHPIILGNKNLLTPLIIADAHVKTLHGGVQLMLCYLRSKYWIVKAKAMAKKHVHKCYVCARLNATTKTQIMGDLPKERVTPSRPFLHSGVDFAGPFQVLMSKGRGNKTKKAYIAIFICLSTKAIHIELVADLTTEAFIGAFRRFVSRRGKCSHLWSDQGRNFVGANKELLHAWKEANLQFTGKIAETIATEGTQWHFIPAYSPNFGGLWEAGVKSIKHHLKRILTTHLTYEEMTTVLCQVEACLNSRPLCPLDDKDPENVIILTPGHFLIGEAPIVVPSPDSKDVKISTLSRWQYTQKLLNDFWRRWQNEYLSRLQQRPKWLRKEEEFNIGDIVLIKTDHLPPGKWSLGRIIEKHPGLDGCTRVYSVKSGSSITKRTVTKLCALPINRDEPIT